MSSSSTDAEYLVKGVDSSGNRRTLKFRADSAKAAVAQLVQQGYTDIVLVTDDRDRAIQPIATGDKAEKLSAADLARIHTLGPLSLRLYTLWMVYRLLWWLAVPPLTLFVLRRAWSQPFSFVDAILCAFVLLPAGLHSLMARNSTSLFNRIQVLYVNAEWQGVLALIDKLVASSARSGNAHFAAMIAAEWKSKTFAHLGRLPEGLALIAQFSERPDVRPETVHQLYAVAYGAAQQHEKVRLEYKQFVRALPDNLMGWMGLAEVCAVWLDRPMEARAALERCQQFPVAQPNQWSATYMEAIVLLSERRYADARRLFVESLPGAERSARKAPLGRGLLAVLRAQYAIACARTNDRRMAASLFAKARPYLELHKLDSLIARYKEASAHK